MNINDYDSKKQAYQKWGQVVGLGIGGYFFYKVAMMAILGFVSLVAFLFIGLAVVQIGIPWVAIRFASWRLSAMKAAIEADPVSAYEEEYRQREAGREELRKSIEDIGGIINDVGQQIEEYETTYKGERSPNHDGYDQMVEAAELLGNRYVELGVKNAEFYERVKRARMNWKAQIALHRGADALALGRSFGSQLREDVALNKIRQEYNSGLAALQSGILDVRTQTAIDASQRGTASAEVLDAHPVKQITQTSSVRKLNLNLPAPNFEPVLVEKSVARNGR